MSHPVEATDPPVAKSRVSLARLLLYVVGSFLGVIVVQLCISDDHDVIIGPESVREVTP